jgi:RNA polymerase sigma-32 factor
MYESETFPEKSERQEEGSPLRQYYATIRNHALLTADEEKSLSKQYLETKDQQALQKLISCNLRLVVKIALEYRSYREQLMDLVQEGNTGLIRAAERFDPTRGVRFAAYAAWWIRAAILKSIVDNHRLVRIGTTATQRRLFFQLQRVRARLAAEEGRSDAERIAEKLNVRVEDVDEMTRRLGWSESSLEAPNDPENPRRIADLLPSNNASPDESLASSNLQEILRREIQKLSVNMNERERTILEARLLAEDPQTLMAIGSRYGVSRERIRQIERNLMTKIKARFAAALGRDAETLFAKDPNLLTSLAA